MNYPREIWNPQGAYMVVFGQEEHAMRKAEGWLDARPVASSDASPSQVRISDSASTEDITPKRRGRPPNVRPISEVA